MAAGEFSGLRSILGPAVVMRGNGESGEVAVFFRVDKIKTMSWRDRVHVLGVLKWCSRWVRGGVGLHFWREGDREKGRLAVKEANAFCVVQKLDCVFLAGDWMIFGLKFSFVSVVFIYQVHLIF